MIERENKPVDTTLTHRKQGSAFDMLAGILRDIRQVVFRNGTAIVDRPGVDRSEDVVVASGFVRSPSVFEIYQQKKAPGGQFNLFVLGKKGTGEFRNTNYMEFVVDHKTGEPPVGEQNQANGQFTMRVTRDGNGTNGLISLVDVGIYGSEYSGEQTFIAGSGDGGIQMSFVNASGTPLYTIYLGSTGVQIIGLPTSSSGLPSGGLWRDSGAGNVLKIVP